MAISQEYTSYLIRLWRDRAPDPSGPPDVWQGEVEHIQSGQRWDFDTLDELLDFLRHRAEDRPVLGWSQGAG